MEKLLPGASFGPWVLCLTPLDGGLKNIFTGLLIDCHLMVFVNSVLQVQYPKCYVSGNLNSDSKDNENSICPPKFN